ncbi:ATP-binding protein [Candidatus Saganbacteria bacterium]|nr:ATP-binding protein [Candidatus Saganbacteria bacterium]
MDKLLLKEVVIEQNKAIGKIDTGIERDCLKSFEKYIKIPHTIVISGMRRTGKSTLLAQIMRQFYHNQYYYFNFEDERLTNFKVEDFNALFEILLELFGEQKTFFFDEIQNAQKWELFIRRMQDTGYKFFLTGSNASLLSRELGTKLTGRNITIELYPFSFNEFLAFKGATPGKNVLAITIERAKIKKYFHEYLKNGGLPEYLKYKDAELLKRGYEDILYRDIVARYEIKEIKSLRELGVYFLSNLASSFAYGKLRQMLQLGSVNTVKNYVEFLENSYVIFTINQFSYSFKKQVSARRKAYCVDNGLAESVAFQFSKNKGSFLENTVFMELKRRGGEVYYFKTAAGLEVDFLLKEEKNKIALIQVAASLEDEGTKNREIRALMAAMEELKIDQALILTEDSEQTIKIKNKTIHVTPIYKWLLEKA